MSDPLKIRLKCAMHDLLLEALDGPPFFMLTAEHEWTLDLSDMACPDEEKGEDPPVCVDQWKAEVL